jgi:hypothetical protein
MMKYFTVIRSNFTAAVLVVVKMYKRGKYNKYFTPLKKS